MGWVGNQNAPFLPCATAPDGRRFSRRPLTLNLRLSSVGVENFFSLIWRDLERPTILRIDAIIVLYNVAQTTQTAALVP